jgi:hypothetical protein
MSDGPETMNHADESQKAESGGTNVRFHLVGFDRPFLTALAVCLSVVAIGGLYVVHTDALRAEREARMAQYYNIDLEVYMAKQGLNPPPDPWRKIPKGNKP